MSDVAAALDIRVEPLPVSDADVCRCDALEILEDQLDKYRHDLAELILRDLPNAVILSIPVEILAASVLTMLASAAKLEAEVDEDGFGHAWVETKLSFADAVAVASWTPSSSRYRPRACGTAAPRRPRSRRTRASRTSRGRPSRRTSGGDDDPPPPSDVAARRAA